MPGSKKHNHGGKGKLEPRKVSATESSLSRLSISWFNSITIDIMWYLRYAKNKEVMTNLWNQISEIADFDKVLRSTFTFANPFSLFHIYFHCLSTTFTHSYPLSLSQIAFSLSCINYQFLRSPFTLLRKPPLSHQIVSFLLERWSRHRGVYGGSGDRLQGQKVSSSCKTSLQHGSISSSLLQNRKYPKYQVLAALRYADLPEAFKFFIEAQFRTIDVDGDGSIGQWEKIETWTWTKALW